jgi:hypothetical protein
MINSPPLIHSPRTVILHGWGDDIVPHTNVIDYAGKNRLELHLLPDGHALENSRAIPKNRLRYFLEQISV